MKRIPKNFIRELLDRVDLVDVIGHVVKLKKTGINYSACCPFHQEKTPSFSVSPQKQFFHCFGCGKHGNAISFLIEHEHLDFVEAVEELSRRMGLTVPYELFETRQGHHNHYGLTDSQHSGDPEKNKDENFNTKLYELMTQAALFFEKQLRENPNKGEAIEYLKSRGLSGKTAKQFSIGYAPNSWDGLLQNFSAFPKDLLIQAGLVIQQEAQPHRLYDRFRNRIMFPIKDRRGRVVGFGGRVLTDEKPKYLNSPETPIFHKGELLFGLFEARKSCANFEQMLLVEGYMDVVALHEHGLSFAVAALGTATSEMHFKILFKLSKKIIIAFDGDHAGKQAAERAMSVALPLLTGQEELKFLFLPENEDPDSYIRKQGQSAFLSLIQQAMPLSKFFFMHLSKLLDLQTLEGRSKLIAQAIPLINKLSDNPYKDLLINQLAQIAKIHPVKIQRQINLNLLKAKNTTDQTSHINTPGNFEKRNSKINTLDLRNISNGFQKVLAFLIQYPDQLSQIPRELLIFPEENNSSSALEIILLRKLILAITELSALSHTPALHAGHILEYFRDEENDHAYFTQLTKIELNLSKSAILKEAIEILRKKQNFPHEERLLTLMEKSKQQELSCEEKQEIRSLLAMRVT